jgi:hypothetical protein
VDLTAPLNGGCAVSAGPGSPVAAGASTTFTISVRADAAGPAGCRVRVVSNEPQQLYSFTLRGTAAAGSPELEVTRGSQTIPNEGVVDAVSVPPGTTALEALTINNVGTAPLDVSATNVLAQTGASCTVTSPTSFSVQPGGATNVQLSITRNGTDDFSCKLELRSNDADEDPTVVSLTSLIRGSRFQVFVNDVPVQSVPESALDDRTRAIDPLFQTSHVVRIVNTGTEDLRPARRPPRPARRRGRRRPSRRRRRHHTPTARGRTGSMRGRPWPHPQQHPCQRVRRASARADVAPPRISVDHPPRRRQRAQ